MLCPSLGPQLGLHQAKTVVALSGQDCKDIAESSYILLRSGSVSSRMFHPYTCNSKSTLSGRSKRQGRSWCEYLAWLAKERQSSGELLRRRDVLTLAAAEGSCPRGSACLDSLFTLSEKLWISHHQSFLPLLGSRAMNFPFWHPETLT